MKRRPYTGFDGVAKGKRKGTERFVKEVVRLSKRNLWNNGTWGVRPIRGSDKMSVHATGRAMDLSWRGKERIIANDVIEFLVVNAAELGIELVIDYFPRPYGRAWKCTRGSWQKYDKKTVSGAPQGDWYHIEISPEFADDPKKVKQAFRSLAV
jgi:hypothetical protein